MPDLWPSGGIGIGDVCGPGSPARTDVRRSPVHTTAAPARADVRRAPVHTTVASTRATPALNASNVRELAGPGGATSEHHTVGTRTRRRPPPPSHDLRRLRTEAAAGSGRGPQR
jgi:hypothetical protein